MYFFFFFCFSLHFTYCSLWIPIICFENCALLTGHLIVYELYAIWVRSEALKNSSSYILIVNCSHLSDFTRFFLNPLGFFSSFFLSTVSPIYNSLMYLEGWWPRYYNITYSVETINRPWWFWSPPRYERTKKNVLHEKDSM